MARAASQYGFLQRLDARPVRDEVEDVVAHLGLLLNVKRDYGSFLPQLGLSISDAMWSARPMASLAAHIREQIETFEPRLRDLKIEPEVTDDHLCPLFRVHGRIGTARVTLLLSLHTVHCTVHVTTEE